MNLVEIKDLINIEEEFAAAELLEVWDYLTQLTQTTLPGNVRFEKQPSRIVMWKQTESRRPIRLLTIIPSSRKKEAAMYNVPEIQETKESKKTVTKENYRQVLQQAFKSIIEANPDVTW